MINIQIHIHIQSDLNFRLDKIIFLKRYFFV